MSSRQINTKRRLPAWMETVHNQSKKRTDQGNHDEVSSKKTNPKFHDATNLNKETVDDKIDSRYCDNGASAISPETACFLVEPLNSASSNLTAAEAIANCMPLLSFKGRIVYSYHHDDCSCLCEDILSGLSNSDKTPVGFDMEWPVSFQTGSTNKTSLIQICISEEICYIFHVSAMLKFPESLKKLLNDPRLTFVGLNIISDFWKLERDFDVRVKLIIDRGSVIDVGKLANDKKKCSEHWSLDGLCRNVLRQRLNKDKELRCGDWSEAPLSNEQILYAASDAFAGYLLYERLKDGGI